MFLINEHLFSFFVLREGFIDSQYVYHTDRVPAAYGRLRSVLSSQFGSTWRTGRLLH